MAIISKEIIKYTLTDIIHKKTRSGLTILSILIGITAIFIFISFGLGLYQYIEAFSSSGSADKIAVMGKGYGGLDEDFILTESDLRAVKSTAGVYEATGTSFKAVEIIQNKVKKYAFLISYDPEKPLMMEMSNVKLKEGRQLKKSDNGKVILGYSYLIKDKIFSKPYELNGKIKVNGIDLQIIGFFDSIGSPQDDAQMYVTNNYFKELFPNQTGYNWIIAKADMARIKDVVEEVKESVRKSRGLKKDKEDFFVQSFNDLIATYSNVLNGVAGFIILIALISVLVSAINTSNTMITSVLERRKEIGVMKSVGARNSEVLKIFLFESGFLGFVAGILGVTLGYMITQSLAAVIKTAGWGFLSPAYPWMLFAGCILFATLTGAISGLAPAIKASRISPVQALRYE